MIRSEQKMRNALFFTFFSLLFIGVGYAVITSNLNINGILSVDKISWDVHFENYTEDINNNIEATYEFINDNTALQYNLTLVKPGDKYSATFDIVNDGTIDAMVSSVSMTGLLDDQKNYIDYSITYLDGTEIKEKDSLPAKEIETILINIEYIYDINNDNLNSTTQELSLTLEINYGQDDGTSNLRNKSLYKFIAENAKLDNTLSTYVTSTTGIDFSKSSSNTNGKGVYIFSDTRNAKYPVYYYRGDINNNNVIFADKCWQIVRTTETGGIKLIYNGVPNENNSCSNTINNIGTSPFNTPDTSLAYVGYMYGDVYQNKKYSLNSLTNQITFGNSVIYNDNTSSYTLQGTTSWTGNITDVSKSRYTCLTSENTCDEVNYFYHFNDNTTGFYITLKNGEEINDALNKMTINSSNKNSSRIKTIIDNWYEENIIDYTNKLEDTIWCNDRSIYYIGPWDSTNSDSSSEILGFSSRKKLLEGTPNLICKNKADQFTVNESNGNGNLTYPIALLTSDEVIISGLSGRTSSNSYLNSRFWTMSPSADSNGYVNMSPSLIVVGENTQEFAYMPNNSKIVRPAISLKRSIKVSAGDGTIDNPYIVN